MPTEFRLGEGLVGQCALEKRRIILTEVPADYVRISSGLGEAKPMNIIVLPVLFEGDTRAVIELASFQRFSPIHQDFLDQLTESIGIVLNTIEANSRTEELLKQSQSLANELQSQQDQLQQTNLELAEKARQLAQQNTEIEQRREEVEAAKDLVEEKAEQLALTSRYKSEFLANMSHELRTPLNSLLILAQELADNPDRNLLPKQVEYATIIRSSGTDLLKLINDILDLSKIESGTVTLEITDWPLAELPPLLERTFRHVAEATKLGFTIDLRPGLPKSIPTDPQRLQQVLNNLLSNAFKFTEKGRVEFAAWPATSGWSRDNESLNRAPEVIAFSVIDTGIGIPNRASSIRSSNRLRRRMAPPAASTVAPALAFRSAASSRACSAERSGSKASWAGAAYSPSTCRCPDRPGCRTPTALGPTGTTNGRVRQRAANRTGDGCGRWGLRTGWHVEAAQAPAERGPAEAQKIVLDRRGRCYPEAAPGRADGIGRCAHDRGCDRRGGARSAGRPEFDAVVLDLGLPGLSGWQVIDHPQPQGAAVGARAGLYRPRT